MRDNENSLRCWIASEPDGEPLKELHEETWMETPPESKRFRTVSTRKSRVPSHARSAVTQPHEYGPRLSDAEQQGDRLKIIRCWLPVTPHLEFSVNFEELTAPAVRGRPSLMGTPPIDESPRRSPQLSAEFGDTETTATPSCNSARSSAWTAVGYNGSQLPSTAATTSTTAAHATNAATATGGPGTNSLRRLGKIAASRLETGMTGTAAPQSLTSGSSGAESLAAYDIAVEVFVDGNFVRGRYRRAGQRAVFKIAKGTMKGGLMPMGVSLQFPDLTDIEDSLSMANDAELGSVCVDVWVGKKTTPGGNVSALLTAEDDNGTPRPNGAPPPAFIIGGRHVDRLTNFAFERRLVRFEFKYRSAGFVASHHFIPVGKYPRVLRRNLDRTAKTVQAQQSLPPHKSGFPCADLDSHLPSLTSPSRILMTSPAALGCGPVLDD